MCINSILIHCLDTGFRYFAVQEATVNLCTKEVTVHNKLAMDKNKIPLPKIKTELTHTYTNSITHYNNTMLTSTSQMQYVCFGIYVQVKVDCLFLSLK